jgi:hypothetical protein
MTEMKIAYYLGMIIVLFFSAGCENDDYLYKDVPRIYLSGDAAQGATADSLFFSFRLYDFETSQYDLHVVANIMGGASSEERGFTLEVVDSLTNVPASAYSVGNTAMPAGAFQQVVKVTVNRTVAGMDLAQENARLTFRVVPNDHFQAGEMAMSTYSLVWCDYLIRPESWTAINYYIGPFSQARYKFILDYTGYSDFTEFTGNYNKILWLQGILLKHLEEYNADPANADRPEGWPYANDNGEPLRFGSGLLN